MSVENIKILQSVEQDINVIYGDRTLKFEIRYNEFSEYWFVNIIDTATSIAIISGLKLTINFNSLKYLTGLGLGKLSLIDTDPTSTTALNVANDLGTRLLLYREYE